MTTDSEEKKQEQKHLDWLLGKIKNKAADLSLIHI